MTLTFALLEWTAAAAAVWFAVEASGTGSTLSMLTAAMCAIAAGMVRQFAFQAMRTRDMDALCARLGLRSRGGAR